MITSIGKHHDSNYEHCQRHHIACLALEELSSVARDKSKRNNDHQEEQTTTNLKSIIVVIVSNFVVIMDIIITITIATTIIIIIFMDNITIFKMVSLLSIVICLRFLKGPDTDSKSMKGKLTPVAMYTSSFTLSRYRGLTCCKLLNAFDVFSFAFYYSPIWVQHQASVLYRSPLNRI